jgi:tetratricopeptide (TPR) repeat protein
MESNYDALIVKKPLAALSLMKQAEAEATKLLATDPNAQDAYLALGTSNYVIGCLSGFKRAFLWFGGVHGDRERGIEQMQRAADHGQYLKPFAKIMLALACEREHQTDRARELLRQLAQEFPSNPIFLHELTLLDHHSAVQCKATASTA